MKKYDLTVNPYVEGYLKAIRDIYIDWGEDQINKGTFYVPIPRGPTTTGCSNILFDKEESLSNSLFLKEILSPLLNGKPINQKNFASLVYIDVLKPSWILDNLQASILKAYGEPDLARVGSRLFSIDKDQYVSLREITLAIYRFYETTRDERKLANHWSIYPCLLCKETHPYILDELRRRVSKPSRIFVLEQAIKVSRYPEIFYKWVVRNATIVSLAEHRTNSPAEFIAHNLSNFITNTQRY